MVEVVGDIVMPSELVIRDHLADGIAMPTGKSGALFMSGAGLYFVAGNKIYDIASGAEVINV